MAWDMALSQYFESPFENVELFSIIIDYYQLWVNTGALYVYTYRSGFFLTKYEYRRSAMHETTFGYNKKKKKKLDFFVFPLNESRTNEKKQRFLNQILKSVI